MGDIDFKVIFAAKNSNKFQKNQVLEGKVSWERGNTWANATGHISVHDITTLKYCLREMNLAPT
jgi:hypothetical protein